MDAVFLGLELSGLANFAIVCRSITSFEPSLPMTSACRSRQRESALVRLIDIMHLY